jgi:hypothetical protein
MTVCFGDIHCGKRSASVAISTRSQSLRLMNTQCYVTLQHPPCTQRWQSSVIDEYLFAMLQDMLFPRTPLAGVISIDIMPGSANTSRSSTSCEYHTASRFVLNDQPKMPKNPVRRPGNSFSKDAVNSTPSKFERRPRTRSASPDGDPDQTFRRGDMYSSAEHSDDERLEPVQAIADNLRKLREETERPPLLPPKPVEYQNAAVKSDLESADISSELLEQFAKMCAIHGDQLIMPDPADLAAVERIPPLFSGRPLHIPPSAPESLEIPPPLSETIVFPSCDELLATVEDHGFRMSMGGHSILHPPKIDPNNSVRQWLKQVLVYDEAGIVDPFDLVLANTSRNLQSVSKAPKPIGPYQFEALCYDVFPNIRQHNTNSHDKAMHGIRGLRWARLEPGTESPPAQATLGWVPGLADQLEKIMEVTPRMQARTYLRMAFEEFPQSAVAQMKVWKNFKTPVKRNEKPLLPEEKFWVSQS